MKERGFNNISNRSPKRESLAGQKIVSAYPTSAKAEQKQKQRNVLEETKKEEDLIIEMNLKFGENFENIKIFKGDSTKEIAHTIAQNNCTIK